MKIHYNCRIWNWRVVYIHCCMYIYIYICSIYFCWESPRFLWGKVSDTYVIPVSFNVIKRVHSWKLAVYPEKNGGFSPSTENHLCFESGPDFFSRFQTVSFLRWVGYGMDNMIFNFTVEFHRISLCELDSFQNLGLYQSIRGFNMWFFASREPCSWVSLKGRILWSQDARSTLRIAACEILWDPFPFGFGLCWGFSDS